MGYSSSYYRSLIQGYKELGKAVGPEVWAALREAEEREVEGDREEQKRQEAVAAREDERLQEFRDEFFVYEDLGWPRTGSGNYRGAHTLRALALFSGKSVDVCHAELLVLFQEANVGRQKVTTKYTNEKTWLAARTEVPNWLVRDWCEVQGYVCRFSKGYGEKGLLLRPENVPSEALLLLTKDWVCVRGGKIVASWNPLWHDHRAVNGVWTKS